ncbi:MAG: PD-(D/E)XK nuclease family protein [Bacteroidales bacterium]|nr:PD-(D/E)XK nuclease family protein [Bacteroidales bacterium]
MKSEQLSFESAINFSNRLVDKRMNSMRTLFMFFDGFGEIYQNEKKKLPFHINIIDELRADENAHSRILAKFLMYEDLISREYDIFKSFIGYLVENYNNKKDFQKIEVKWPTLTVEKERIDLWIRDSNYVLIVENKVQNAGDQYKQLERYIDTSKNYGYKEEDIYVLYLPPTYEKEPDTESWGKYYETDIYNNRYLKLSFRDDILPWLKNDVLHNVRIKERLLMSSLEQYIDHLEGKFSLRTINDKMNMKLQEFIKENLEITNAEPEYSLTKVLEKKEEVEDALNQLKQLEHSIKIDHFKKWERCLKDKYKDFDIVNNWSQGNKTNYLGVKIVEGESIFSLIIGYDIQSIYYGISRHFATDAKDNRLNFEEIITELNLTKDDNWYGYRITSFENAYMRLSALIDKVVNRKQYQIKDTSIGEDISVNQIK